MRIPLIAQDKANHVVYGSLIAATVVFVASAAVMALAYFGVPHEIGRVRVALTAQVASTLIAAWKEWIYDSARPTTNTVSVADFWATVAGGLLVTSPVLAGGFV